MAQLFQGGYSKLYGAALERLFESPDGPVMTDAFERGVRIEHRATSKVRPSRVRGGPGAQTRQGRSLRDSGETVFIRSGEIASLSYTLGDLGRSAVAVRFPKPYAAVYDQGSPPHEIRARRKPLLVFYWPKVGQVVAFPKGHRHIQRRCSPIL
jgi:hypothetical protein